MTSFERLSFAQLATPSHPSAERASFTPAGTMREPDMRDRDIAEEIAAIIRRARGLFGSSDGEWSFLDRQKRGRYIAAITDPATTKDDLAHLFANMFRNDATYGVVTPSFADADAGTVANQILLDLDTCVEFARPSELDELLFEAGFGNPFGLLYGDRIVAPDTPRHYYFARRIDGMLEQSVLDDPGVIEIGAGYGGMPLLLSRMRPGLRYLGIDLFETSLLQYYFLRKAGVAAEFVLKASDLQATGIQLAPVQLSQELMRRDESVSVVFNSRSFSEMSAASVDGYFRSIQSDVSPEFIYHENSNYLLFPNSVRHIEILGSQFPIDSAAYRLAEMNVSRFLGGSGRYREFLYARR